MAKMSIVMLDTDLVSSPSLSSLSFSMGDREVLLQLEGCQNRWVGSGLAFGLEQ